MTKRAALSARTRRRGYALATVLVVGAAACGGGGKAATTTTRSTAPPVTPPKSLTSQEVFERTKLQAVLLTGRKGDSQVGGTGIVLDAQKALILTNAHVVAGVGALKVRVGDQASEAARVVATAPCEDVAIVQLVTPPGGMQQATLGDSSIVKNQDQVVALGYPASFADASTEKVNSSSGAVQSPNVSAKPDASLPEYPSVIQHSATINPGNSGGPLYDDKARVIGMNTLTNTGSASQPVQGQFYAISINHIKQLLPGLESGKSLANAGWDVLPFSQVKLADVYKTFGFGTSSEGALAEQQLVNAGISNQDGLIVASVDAGSPATDAKLEAGDLVTSLNDVPIKNVSEACGVLQSATPGQPITVRGIYTRAFPSDNPPTALGDRWNTKLTLK